MKKQYNSTLVVEDPTLDNRARKKISKNTENLSNPIHTYTYIYTIYTYVFTHTHTNIAQLASLKYSFEYKQNKYAYIYISYIFQKLLLNNKIVPISGK